MTGRLYDRRGLVESLGEDVRIASAGLESMVSFAKPAVIIALEGNADAVRLGVEIRDRRTLGRG